MSTDILSDWQYSKWKKNAVRHHVLFYFFLFYHRPLNELLFFELNRSLKKNASFISLFFLIWSNSITITIVAIGSSTKFSMHLRFTQQQYIQFYCDFSTHWRREKKTNKIEELKSLFLMQVMWLLVSYNMK